MAFGPTHLTTPKLTLSLLGVRSVDANVLMQPLNLRSSTESSESSSCYFQTIFFYTFYGYFHQKSFGFDLDTVLQSVSTPDIYNTGYVGWLHWFTNRFSLKCCQFCARWTRWFDTWRTGYWFALCWEGRVIARFTSDCSFRAIPKIHSVKEISSRLIQVSNQLIYLF